MHSIDLNLTTAAEHSLASPTPPTSPVVVGRDVHDAPTAASGEAFRRAMEEPIAESAALGEAFAAAVAATGAVGVRVPARPQDPGVVDVAAPLTSPDTAASASDEAAPAVAGERERALAGGFAVASQPSLQTQSVFRRISRPYQAQANQTISATDSPVASPVGRDDPIAPTAEPNLTRSHGATEAGQTAPVAVAKGDVSGDSDESPAAPLASPSPLTPHTLPDTAVAAAAAVATASTSATAPAASSSPSTVLVQAAEAVADTLLVSPGLLRGQGEIVVQLRPDVLDGTEVRIAVTGRQLDVQFCPTSVEMAVMLENGRTQIASHLSAKIASFNVTVDVRKKRT